MSHLVTTIALIGWVIATILGIQNHNLKREINDLKLREEARARENKRNHKRLEAVLHGLGNIIAQTESITNAKQKVDEIFRLAEEQAAEELRNEEL